MVADQKQKPTEVLIEGRLFDCANFKHPGGSILKYYLGTGDATETFMEFHCKSKKAYKMLENLPNRPAPLDSDRDPKEAARQAKLSRDFKKLHDELQRDGWYDANYLHVAYRLGEIVAMHVFGLFLLLKTPLWPIALFILGIAEGRCGWAEHEGGHASLTGNIYIDRKIQEIVYGLGDGMSASWWRSQHNKHHATPQKLRHDVDLETLPLVAWHREVAKRAKNKPIVRAWIKMQMYLFAPITCSLVAIFWQLYLHPRHMWRSHRYTEMISCAARYVFIAVLCAHMGLTARQSILGYLFYQSFGAIYIFVNFALSHTHLDVLQQNDHVHWVEYASVYTANVAPHWFTDWWMGYLNYQIEHHLFPCMPQYRFVKLSPRVRKMFEDNGLKYIADPYFYTLAKTFRNLGDVGTMSHE